MLSGLSIGDLIYKRNASGNRAFVRKILGISNGVVSYEFVHGYKKLGTIGKCGISGIRSLKGWKFVPPEAKKNLDVLDGCFIYENYNVLGPDDKCYFVCGSRKANFYLSKGYANKVNDNTIKLSNWSTIDKLEQLHGKGFTEKNAFFLAQKNKRCAVCGYQHALSRHHVVPQRNKTQLPLEIKRCLSNILFICLECHANYEEYLIQNQDHPQMKDDPIEYCLQWEQHFVRVMNPKYLPEGWKILYPNLIASKQDLQKERNNNGHQIPAGR